MGPIWCVFCVGKFSFPFLCVGGRGQGGNEREMKWVQRERGNQGK